MALPTASDNIFPKVSLGPLGAPAAPADASWKLYPMADGIYARSSNSSVGPFGTGGGGSVATDAIWDAAGDTVVGSGANTAVRRMNNPGATVAPAVTDDSGDGYAIGSRWLDTTADKEYVALDVTVGAAVWKETTAAAGGATVSQTSLSGSTVSVTSGADATVLSLSLAAGTWMLFGNVCMTVTAPGADFYCWIDDGSTVMGSGQSTIPGGTWQIQIPVLAPSVVLGSTTTIYLKARSTGTTGTAQIATPSGTKGLATSLWALKVA